MKRLVIIISALIFFSLPKANAVLSSLPTRDSSLVTLITTSGKVMYVKIVKIDLDYYYVLPQGRTSIWPIRKDKIKQLRYPDGLILNVAQSYRKGRGKQLMANRLFLLSLGNLFALPVLAFLEAFPALMPLFFSALIIDNLQMPYYIYTFVKSINYDFDFKFILFNQIIIMLVVPFIALFDFAFLYFI